MRKPILKWKTCNRMIIVLALAHRYLLPVLLILLPLLLSEENWLLYMGIGFILLAVYDFLGYKLRWKHIFCSYQNAYHRKMTPERINWNSVKKSDAYCIPIICGVLGLAVIALYFYCL